MPILSSWLVKAGLGKTLSRNFCPLIPKKEYSRFCSSYGASGKSGSFSPAPLLPGSLPTLAPTCSLPTLPSPPHSGNRQFHQYLSLYPNRTYISRLKYKVLFYFCHHKSIILLIKNQMLSAGICI